MKKKKKKKKKKLVFMHSFVYWICNSLGKYLTSVYYRYRHADLQGPGYVTVDKEGIIYVISRLSRNIHLVKPDGRQLKILRLEGGPEATSISYRQTDEIFVVGSNNSNVIKTYKLF